jgi:hypothetical protein
MKKNICAAILCIFVRTSFAQEVVKTTVMDSATVSLAKKNLNFKDDIRYNLNESGSNYIKLTFCNQIQTTFNQNNAGSTVNQTPENNTWDISIRRLRFQVFGQLTDRIFFYTQIGQNNFTYNSQRKFGFFVHDAITEYAFIPTKLSIGGGLTGWTGLSRYSSPSVSNFAGIDAPIFEQYENDINDQFLRKLSIYAKGKLGKLDYRLAISKPFQVQAPPAVNIAGGQAPVNTPAQAGLDMATFATTPPNPQWQGYLMYQFLNQEANLTPYTQGTYLGKKNVFNIGGGFVYQNSATVATLTGTGGWQYYDLKLFALDVYYDTPINKEKGTAINFYSVYMKNDFGQNYVRNLGINNPADTKSLALPNLNNTAGGNAFAIQGTGSIGYTQIAYKMKDNLLGKSGTLMPYISSQYAKYDLYADLMVIGNVGINWLIKGHNAKITLDYQNRPFFAPNSIGQWIQQSRNSQLTLQYQIFF